MMCSIEELGSDREMYPDTGKWIIYPSEDAPVGEDCVAYPPDDGAELKLHQTV